jgi:hypothetical protein
LPKSEFLDVELRQIIWAKKILGRCLNVGVEFS